MHESKNMLHNLVFFKSFKRLKQTSLCNGTSQNSQIYRVYPFFLLAEHTLHLLWGYFFFCHW